MSSTNPPTLPHHIQLGLTEEEAVVLAAASDKLNHLSAMVQARQDANVKAHKPDPEQLLDAAKLALKAQHGKQRLCRTQQFAVYSSESDSLHSRLVGLFQFLQQYYRPADQLQNMMCRSLF